LIREMSEESGLQIPAALEGLSGKTILHDTTIAKEDMIAEIRKLIP